MNKSNKQKFFVVFTALLLASCGGGGGGGGSDNAAPTMTLSSDLSQVIVGNVATLTWSSNQTSCSASGAWSGSKVGSGSEQVTISSAGANNFSLSCGSTSRQVTVTGNRLSAGNVVDGYLSGSTVFYDLNDNLTVDADEDSETSGSSGEFSLGYLNDGVLVSLGGTDVDTQTLLDELVLAAPNDGYIDGPVITPLTTLAVLMEEPENINTIFGLDSSINILNTDPVAKLGEGGVYNILYEKGNQVAVLALSMTNVVNYQSSDNVNTANSFLAIADQLEEAYSTSSTKVDIESQSFIEDVVNQVLEDAAVSISDVDKANTVKALVSTLPQIQVKSDSAVTTSIINFALNTLQSDIAYISAGVAGTETTAKYSVDSISAYISSTESIPVSALNPEVLSIDDSGITDEDTAITLNVLVNDNLIPGEATITISSAPTKGSVSISGDSVTYTPSADENGDDSFTYTVTVNGVSSTSTVSISITPVNDAPSISAQTSATIVEGSTSVSDVKISDVDGDDVTITLSGVDADSFEVIDGVLTFKSAPDFFVKNAYSVTIVATDGPLESSVDLTINVRRLQVEGFEIPDAIKVIETL